MTGRPPDKRIRLAAVSRSGGQQSVAEGAALGPACPLCGKPREQAYRPFCSKRCADIDLNRWLSEVYRTPAAPADDESE
jgi:hypothetical protein